MKRLIVLFIALMGAEVSSAWTVKESTSNTDYSVYTSPGGVSTKNLVVTGATPLQVEIPDGTAAAPGLSWISGSTLGLFKTGTSLGFATAGVQAGLASASGAWTFGVTGSVDPTLAHLFYLPNSSPGAAANPSTSQGFIKFLNGTSSGSQPGIFLNAGTNTNNGAVSVNAFNSDTSTGGDMQFTDANNASGAFGTSYTTLSNKAYTWQVTGVGEIANATRAGAMTVGPANKQFKTGDVGQAPSTGGVTIFGNPSNVMNVAGAGGTATYRLTGSGSNSAAFCMIQSGSNNAATFFVSNGSVTIVTQPSGTEFVSGAPGAAQLGITYANANSLVTYTSGSGAGHSVYTVCMSPAL